MSRSIHKTRKSAQRALEQGDLEPIKEYSLKLDLKKWSKKFDKEKKTQVGMLDSVGVTSERRKNSKKRVKNSILFSALKKVKKGLNRKFDERF